MNKYGYEVINCSKLDISFIKQLNLERFNGKKVVIQVKNTKYIDKKALLYIKNNYNLDVKISVIGPYEDTLATTEKQKDRYFHNTLYELDELYNIITQFEKIEENIDPKWNQYDIIVYLAETLIRNIMYDPEYFLMYTKGQTVPKKVGQQDMADYYDRSLRGMLTRKTVCAGYSVIFKELANRSGIECKYVNGKAHSINGTYRGAHAWNLVRINGVIYPIDITWKNTKYRKGDFNNIDNISCDVEEFKIRSSGMLHEVLSEIEFLLTNEGIPCEIKFRIKNIYGVYKQLQENHQLADIHDLLALRVMVDEVKDCYLSLMLIHSKYKPINDKFKDYICNPKRNLYSSLHTTIFGPQDQLIQTRIRTHEMDKIASYGLPTYWDLYQGEGRHVMQQELRNKFQFFKSLNEIDKMFTDNAEFVERVKREIFSSTIYVYTPKGEMIELPVGATVIDFAYRIHSNIGNTMNHAMVNDRIVGLDYQLQNNDRVKILTSSLAEGPNDEWLDLAQTTHAKRKIKEFIARTNQAI